MSIENMNQELARIIGMFNTVQKKAVEVLEHEFNCPKPINPMDFITRCVPAIRKVNYESGGYKILPHGVGMEITIQGQKIDFDFGENGEFNGFDSWRLYDFIKDNNIKSSIATEEKMKEIVQDAISNGYVTEGTGMGNVNYISS